MSAAFTIYNGAKIEIEIGEASHGTHCGWIELTVTEIDGKSHEITVHFDTAEGFAAAEQLAHLHKAINAHREPA